ncbi:MAG: PEP-CTERM sorting domain-containing protein [Phycisphaerales bacterium]
MRDVVIAGAAALLMSVGTAQAGLGDGGDTTLVLADSMADFGGNQGENGWFYGFYDGNVDAAFTPDDFELMNVYDDGNDRWWADDSSDGPITLIDAVFMHPNSFLDDQRDSSEQWSVRRWVSGVSADVNINVNLSRANPEFAGDGVVLRMFIDGVQTLAVELFADNDAGLSFDLSTTVAEGSVIDFAVDPIENALFDAVRFDTVITTIVPAPTALATLGFGMMCFGRRRR